MTHPGFIEREAVLSRCPDAWCRRSRRCKAEVAATPQQPCLRTHEDMDTFRYRLGDELFAIAKEHPRDPALPPLSPLELDQAMAAFKQALEARIAEDDAARALRGQVPSAPGNRGER
jgi:hypothetical protein